MLELLALAVFASLLIYAACSDVATMTIPNWVSIALAALYPLAALASGASFGEIGAHVLFGFGVLLIAFVMFQFGILGGGDAKLISAAAVWTGAGAFAPFVLGTAIPGGVLALVLLITRARVRPGETRPAFVNRLLTPKGGVPYGVAIMTGGLAALHALPFSAMALTLP